MFIDLKGKICLILSKTEKRRPAPRKKYQL